MKAHSFAKWTIGILGFAAVTALIWHAAGTTRALVGQNQGGGAAHSGGFKQRQAAAVTNGLVGWYKLDGNAQDSGPGGYHGTLMNTSGTVSSGHSPQGKFGGGVAFDGTNDYLDTATDIPYRFEDASFSVSFWFRMPASVSQQYLLGKGLSGGGWGVAMSSSCVVQFWYRDILNTPGVMQSTSSGFCDSQWHHVAVTFTTSTSAPSSNTGAMYIDGVLATSPYVGSALYYAGSADSLEIGRRLGGDYYLGEIDDVRLYNRLITTTEIADLHRGSAPTGCDQTCVAWWRFDEGSGSSAADSSGQGLAAALGATTEAPAWTSGVFGKGLKFDGVDDKVSLADNDLLDVMSYDKTWSFWFSNTAFGTQQYLYRKSGGSNAAGIIVQITATGTLRADLRTNDGSQAISLSPSSPVVTDGIWHHGAVTLDRTSDTLALYVDGVQRGTTSAGVLHSDVPNSSASAFIGGGNSNNSSGYMDDVRIYNRALAAHEIYEQYVAGR